MKPQKNKIYFISFVISLLFFSSVQVILAKPSIKLGVVGPHSGPLKEYGLPTVNATKMVVEKINKNGGINGRLIELFVEDDLCKPEVATRIATKLVSQNVDVVIGHICSGASIAAAPIYKNSGVLMMSPSATSLALTQSGKYDNFFRTIPPDNAQSEVIVNFVTQQLGLRHFALIHDTKDYGKGLVDYVKSYLIQSNKGDVVLYEGLDPNKYASIAQKIKRSGAQIVVFGGYYPEAAKLVSQIREQNIKVEFISGDGVKDGGFLKYAGRRAEGSFATDVKDVTNSPAVVKIRQQHVKMFGTQPGAFFDNAYTAATVLLQSIEQAGTTDQAALSRVLKSRSFSTAFGKFGFDVNGNPQVNHYAIYRVENGQFTTVESFLQAESLLALKSRPAVESDGKDSGSVVQKKLQTKILKTRDNKPPQIVITSHDIANMAALVQKGKYIEITGKASDNSGVVEVLVNNQEAYLDENGGFLIKLLLKPGKNYIDVVAMDIHENQSKEKFVVLRETKQPPLAQPSAQEKIRPEQNIGGEFHALVIGINNYQQLPVLETAVNDAKSIGRILEENYGFNVNLLVDATYRQIVTELNNYRKKLKKNDHFLIYYAGHGEFDKIAQKSYWLPVDAAPDSDIDWIMADKLTTNMKRITSNHILVVADSCYSGTLTRSSVTRLDNALKREKYMKKMIKKSSRTLMASGGNEPVSDEGGDGHSIFALAFIDGLREMDKTMFTAEELYYEFVKERVAGNADQTPEYNTIKNSGHDGGDFVFKRVN